MISAALTFQADVEYFWSLPLILNIQYNALWDSEVATSHLYMPNQKETMESIALHGNI